VQEKREHGAAAKQTRCVSVRCCSSVLALFLAQVPRRQVVAPAMDRRVSA